MMVSTISLRLLFSETEVKCAQPCAASNLSRAQPCVATESSRAQPCTRGCNHRSARNPRRPRIDSRGGGHDDAKARGSTPFFFFFLFLKTEFETARRKFSGGQPNIQRVTRIPRSQVRRWAGELTFCR